MISQIEDLTQILERQVSSFTDIGVVGVSGGVDSAVVASICVAALGKENTWLISMPFDEIDINEFNRRSSILAAALGASHRTIPIGQSSLVLEKEITTALGQQELAQLTRANIRPRVRMNVLYSFSRELEERTGKRARVMGTGHLSEDLIGYDTKGGDALADIFILSDLLKNEVYQLAQFYNVPDEIIKAEPSAGLYPGQTDALELGFTYAELEPATLAVFQALQDGVKREELSPELERFSKIESKSLKFVIDRYKIHYHKHEAPKTVPLREYKELFTSSSDDQPTPKATADRR